MSLVDLLLVAVLVLVGLRLFGWGDRVWITSFLGFSELVLAILYIAMFWHGVAGVSTLLLGIFWGFLAVLNFRELNKPA